MKATLMVTAGLLALGTASAMAQDGEVSQSALAALGLGGMQGLSDEDGLQIRGEGHRSDSIRIISRSSASVRVIDRKHSSKIVAKTRTKTVIKTSSKGYDSPHKGYGYDSPHKGYDSPHKGYDSPHKGYGYGSPSKGYDSPSKHYGSGSSSIAIAKVSVGKSHASAFAFAAAGGFKWSH